MRKQAAWFVVLFAVAMSVSGLTVMRASAQQSHANDNCGAVPDPMNPACLNAILAAADAAERVAGSPTELLDELLRGLKPVACTAEPSSQSAGVARRVEVTLTKEFIKKNPKTSGILLAALTAQAPDSGNGIYNKPEVKAAMERAQATVLAEAEGNTVWAQSVRKAEKGSKGKQAVKETQVSLLGVRKEVVAGEKLNAALVQIRNRLDLTNPQFVANLSTPADLERCFAPMGTAVTLVVRLDPTWGQQFGSQLQSRAEAVYLQDFELQAVSEDVSVDKAARARTKAVNSAARYGDNCGTCD